MVTFYLGTHLEYWLEDQRFKDVPLCVSRNRFARRSNYPRATTRWVLDSAAFTEISTHGFWRSSYKEYVLLVRRLSQEVGNLDWAAIQDWMCEPFILRKTGLSVAEHQARTTQSYLELLNYAPELPWLPTLQGWSADDYFRHIELYQSFNIDLLAMPIVGIGSICKRQHLPEIHSILSSLTNVGLRLHAFGLKTSGLKATKDILASADSMAWSWEARREGIPAFEECYSKHNNCANCATYALWWYNKLGVS